jgi:hypothetical protein
MSNLQNVINLYNAGGFSVIEDFGFTAASEITKLVESFNEGDLKSFISNAKGVSNNIKLFDVEDLLCELMGDDDAACDWIEENES